MPETKGCCCCITCEQKLINIPWHLFSSCVPSHAFKVIYRHKNRDNTNEDNNRKQVINILFECQQKKEINVYEIQSQNVSIQTNANSKSSHPHCCQRTNNACKIPEHLNVTKLTILHNLAVYCDEGEMKISTYHRKEIIYPGILKLT